MHRSPSLHRLLTPLLAATLYTGLSACGPAPTSSPSALPGTSPQASPTAPGPTSAPTTGQLRLKLQADASLAAFSTAQQSSFNLCFASVAAVETRIGSQNLGRRALGLKELLAGIEFELGALPAGPLEGQTQFLDAAGASIGFVSWQTELPATGRTVIIRLSAGSEAATAAPAASACPALNASIEGGSLRATGSSAAPQPSASPTPGTTPVFPSPVPSAHAITPAAPANLQLVERGTDYLTLKWDFGGEPVSYKLYLDGQPVAENHTSPDYYRFTGLSPESTHRLGVQAIGNTGTAGAIASLEGRTLASGSSASGNFSSGGNSGGGTSRGTGTSIKFRAGDEFQVNTYTLGDQNWIDVAINEDGKYVVVWESNGQDGSGSGVYGQRYDSQGEPDGNEFPVNPYTFGNQQRPKVEMDSVGNFVVVWYGAGSADDEGIYARRFEADGDPLGDAFVVNAYLTGAQTSPELGLNDDGSFVAVWNSTVQNAGNSSVYGRVFTAGDLGGSEFIVNSYTSIGSSKVSVGSDEDGNFVVVWHGNDPDEDRAGIFGRRFSADGTALDDVFHINTATFQTQITPHIAMDEDGDFIVAWESQQENNGSDGDIYARRFKADAEPIGAPFLVNKSTAGDQYQPYISLRENGEFAIAWTSELPEQGSGETLFKIFSSSGQPISAETQTNEQTEGFQGTPVVALNSDGDIFVLWENSLETDSQDYGVAGKFYRR